MNISLLNFIPIKTNPTGLNLVPPPGPAIPVIDKPKSDLKISLILQARSFAISRVKAQC